MKKMKRWVLQKWWLEKENRPLKIFFLQEKLLYLYKQIKNSYMRPYNRLSSKSHYQKGSQFKGKKKIKRRPEEYVIPGAPMGVKVLDGNIEAALRKFKKLVKESGVLFELKERREFSKPSAKKTKKMETAKRRQYHISLEELRERLY